MGGMAELFLARKSGIDGFEKLVVVKRILPHLAVNEELVRMFLDEARLAAQLHHPNIAQVYDLGREGACPFFVMEWVRGHDLRDVMRRAAECGGLPLEHAVNIVCGVAAGLHHAHEQTSDDGKPLGIVHRDVSPANVLVTFDGGVKLVDFGVAKARSRQTQTRTGTLKGKIAYMSPEQCLGEEVDRRSDVFALGILLYELSTGYHLFHGDNEFKMMRQITNHDVPPPSARVPGYPPELSRILLRALARDRRKRTATAEDLHLELERFAAHSRLSISSVELRRYMRELFRDSPGAGDEEPTGLSDAPGRMVEMEADSADEWDSFEEEVATARQQPHAGGAPASGSDPGVPAATVRSPSAADRAAMRPLATWPLPDAARSPFQALGSQTLPLPPPAQAVAGVVTTAPAGDGAGDAAAGETGTLPAIRRPGLGAARSRGPLVRVVRWVAGWKRANLAAALTVAVALLLGAVLVVRFTGRASVPRSSPAAVPAAPLPGASPVGAPTAAEAPGTPAVPSAGAPGAVPATATGTAGNLDLLIETARATTSGAAAMAHRHHPRPAASTSPTHWDPDSPLLPGAPVVKKKGK
jgi:serine/threonine protein kinase